MPPDFSLTNLLTLIPLIVALITAATTAYKHMKAKKYAAALKDSETLLSTAVKVIDAFKGESHGSHMRDKVGVILKRAGSQLEEAGLKSKMDAKLKELGVTDSA
jgi:hypothetical protein